LIFINYYIETCTTLRKHDIFRAFTTIIMVKLKVFLLIVLVTYHSLLHHFL